MFGCDAHLPSGGCQRKKSPARHTLLLLLGSHRLSLDRAFSVVIIIVNIIILIISIRTIVRIRSKRAHERRAESRQAHRNRLPLLCWCAAEARCTGSRRTILTTTCPPPHLPSLDFLLHTFSPSSVQSSPLTALCPLRSAFWRVSSSCPLGRV